MSSYQGYTNYETWAVSLWMSNDQDSYTWFSDMADEAVINEISDYEFAQQIKEYFEEVFPELDDVWGVWADLLNSAFEEIDWMEIANNLLDEAKDNMDYFNDKVAEEIFDVAI